MFINCPINKSLTQMLLIQIIYSKCCFFFFKQKTAYEMRISDWSSDVCSSDLRQHFRMKGKVEHTLPLGPEMLAMLRARLDRFTAVYREWEIGRASCRERECQYV